MRCPTDAVELLPPAVTPVADADAVAAATAAAVPLALARAATLFDGVVEMALPEPLQVP
jgi:hypothetical protein